MDTKKINTILGIEIENLDHFKIALTHRSYLNEHRDYKFPSNERLEFLGDAVLQFLTSEHLYKNHPKSPEGLLTNYRAAIVCTKSLAERSKELGYGELLLLSKGEEETGGRDREYILANTFEAVLGALYLDQNINTCRKFLEKTLFPHLKPIIENEEYKDHKSTFQEIAQERFGITPIYQVLSESGPDHAKRFITGVFAGSKKYGEGEGSSKQKAEQAAARDALEKLGEV